MPATTQDPNAQRRGATRTRAPLSQQKTITMNSQWCKRGGLSARSSTRAVALVVRGLERWFCNSRTEFDGYDSENGVCRWPGESPLTAQNPGRTRSRRLQAGVQCREHVGFGIAATNDEVPPDGDYLDGTGLARHGSGEGDRRRVRAMHREVAGVGPNPVPRGVPNVVFYASEFVFERGEVREAGTQCAHISNSAILPTVKKCIHELSQEYPHIRPYFTGFAKDMNIDQTASDPFQKARVEQGPFNSLGLCTAISATHSMGKI
ncbi:hypothetical protein C8J57DRAFT_1247894 [Mycena rebaudengoi]|nr:hypothetical protein C8J57DRAFT_1247894 [Mycena rebaudengoi]